MKSKDYCIFAAVMKPQRLFGILLLLWVAIDFLQAIVTPVHADEAYYALYGAHLAWGYYDHPPMVALMTAFSSLLFSKGLSIRFLTVLLHGATVWLVWKTLPDKPRTTREVWVFFAIAASLVMFVAYGVMTTPDAPLLFFVALFFFLYRQYLQKPGWGIVLCLGLAMAGMLYSKYMAVLVVGFVLLSNLRLLKDPKIWVAGFVALALFLPHILWQVQKGFPSFQYHLVARNTGFNILHPLEFLPNQLLVFNPVCFCLALFLCWRYRGTGDAFMRACIYSIIGFILFFWLMTLKGHAEPHWTVAASVPMLLLIYHDLRQPAWEKWLRYGVMPMACILLIVRIILPVLSVEKIGVLGNKKKMETIHEYCKGKQAVFVGSFQNPSLYSYYTGEQPVQLSSLYMRRTQFDLWQSDRQWQGKPVCLIGAVNAKSPIRDAVDLFLPGAEFSFREVKSFQGANRIEITVDQYRIAGDTLFLDMTLYNPYDVPYDFNHPEFETTLHVAYKMKEYFAITCPVPAELVIPAGGSVKCSTYCNYIPNTPFVVCLDNGACRSVNSKPMVIKDHDR